MDERAVSAPRGVLDPCDPDPVAPHPADGWAAASRVAPAEPAVRRFVLDPASSPMLLAALAWHTAGPRR